MMARRPGKLSCLTVHWPDVGTTVMQLVVGKYIIIINISKRKDLPR